MADGDDVFVTTLLNPGEYAKHLNQVAGLTTRNIQFLKRKFVSQAGWDLVLHPVADCVGITYRDERPVAGTLLGILLVALIGIIGYGLVSYWDALTPGTRVPVGALGLAAIYGLRTTFLSRRHRLVFTMKDGSRLTWKTAAGDYKYQQPRAEKVIEFAKSRGLLRDSELRRPA